MLIFLDKMLSVCYYRRIFFYIFLFINWINAISLIQNAILWSELSIKIIKQILINIIIYNNIIFYYDKKYFKIFQNISYIIFIRFTLLENIFLFLIILLSCSPISDKTISKIYKYKMKKNKFTNNIKFI